MIWMNPSSRPNLDISESSMVSRILERARELGFLGIGFSEPGRPLHYDRFCAWISENKNAGMSWLERHLPLRKDPAGLLPGCRTIISLALPYSSQKSLTPDGLTVSRYSQPTEHDYHYRLRDLCRDLGSVVEEMDEATSIRVCVDSAPILERSFACSSGIGFFGKNNMLIIPGYGSYFFLGELLTTTRIGFDAPEPLATQCGSCTLCIDSCPTGALERPFCLNSSRCLSYLTIEYKGEIGRENGRRMGACFFGCDRCQEVCPFNRADASTEVSLPSRAEFLTMEEEEFQKRYGETTFARAGLQKIKANIRLLGLEGGNGF